MPLVSIIVPVYKAEQWLHRCVDSILAQTMTDFELLLIDDGSPDKSGEICDEYAAKDSRVRVFHKENGGVSSARNLGLDNARGEWISFVDADDWVEVDYLAGLTEKLDADFIVGGCRYTTGEIFQLKSKYLVEKSIADFIQEYNGCCFIRAVWGKLFKKKIIDEKYLRFDEKIRVGEDTIFNKSFFVEINKTLLVERVAYNYYSEISANKYNLSLHEIDYISCRIQDINDRLLVKFGVEIDKLEIKRFFLSMYTNLVRTDKELFSYYDLVKKFYPNITLSQFCGDVVFSPIIQMITELKSLCKKNQDNFKDLYNKLVLISRVTPWYIKFQYKDFYLWYFLIKLGYWNILYCLMNIYFKIK